MIDCNPFICFQEAKFTCSTRKQKLSDCSKTSAAAPSPKIIPGLPQATQKPAQAIPVYSKSQRNNVYGLCHCVVNIFSRIHLLKAAGMLQPHGLQIILLQLTAEIILDGDKARNTHTGFTLHFLFLAFSNLSMVWKLLPQPQERDTFCTP